MGYVHRYWIQADQPFDLATPPPVLRPAVLCGPTREGWFCLDVERIAAFVPEYARRISLAKHVRRVLAFFEETVSSTESCSLFQNGQRQDLPSVTSRDRHPCRTAAEAVLGSDPWKRPEPRIHSYRTYRNWLRDIGLMALAISFIAQFLARILIMENTVMLGTSFLIGFSGAYVWLRQYGHIISFGLAFLISTVVAIVAALAARMM
jgi:hypothetical protein